MFETLNSVSLLLLYYIISGIQLELDSCLVFKVVICTHIQQIFEKRLIQKKFKPQPSELQ